LFSRLAYLVFLHYYAKEETHKTAHWCIVCATQCNCCSALGLFSPVPRPHPPNSPELNALITRFRESYSCVIMSHESKRLKKSGSNWLNSGNSLIQISVKMQFSLSPSFASNAETQVVWGDTVKRLLIAYSIGNVSAKKNQNPFTCVRVIASQMRDVFETRCILTSAVRLVGHISAVIVRVTDPAVRYTASVVAGELIRRAGRRRSCNHVQFYTLPPAWQNHISSVDLNKVSSFTRSTDGKEIPKFTTRVLLSSYGQHLTNRITRRWSRLVEGWLIITCQVLVMVGLSTRREMPSFTRSKSINRSTLSYRCPSGV